MDDKLLNDIAKSFVVTALSYTNQNWRTFCQSWSKALKADLSGDAEAKLEFSMAIIGLGLSRIKRDSLENTASREVGKVQAEKIRDYLRVMSGNLGDEPWEKAMKYHNAYENCPNFDSRFDKPPFESRVEAIAVVLFDSFKIAHLIKIGGRISYEPLTLMMLAGTVLAAYQDCKNTFQSLL
ncbi:MAG: hypothetical protein WC133_02375 [Candidatus Omnitrophota bacterium]